MKRKNDAIILFLVMLVIGLCKPLGAEVLDKIVAIVDTDIVTKVQLEREIAPYLKQVESAGYSDEKKKESIENIKKQALDHLIEKSLTQQEAKKYGIKVSAAEIDNAVENVKQSRSLSDDELAEGLAREGLTLEAYKKNLEKQILRARLINHAVKSKVVVSKASIKKYYEENIDKYAGIQKYHIRNILMDDHTGILEVKKLLDGNQDFIELAKIHSIAPNAPDGGDLGMFDISNFPESIKKAISALEKGDHTDVISTARGYQIFYLQDVVMEGGKTEEQAYDEIHGMLYKDQVEKKFKDWLEDLKEKAHIKIML